MDQSEIKKLANAIRHENESIALREEFEKHGIKFFDRHGWGYIRDKVKHYEEKNDH
jgi:hypothetical protein